VDKQDNLKKKITEKKLEEKKLKEKERNNGQEIKEKKLK
jgi:hypothetical protein